MIQIKNLLNPVAPDGNDSKFKWKDRICEFEGCRNKAAAFVWLEDEISDSGYVCRKHLSIVMLKYGDKIEDIARKTVSFR